MTNMTTESKRQLTDQLEAQGWTLVDIIGKIWCVKDSDGHTMRVEVTAHRDGRQADYEIVSTNDHEFHPDWAAYREAEKVKQAEVTVQQSGGLVIPVENVERYMARQSELHEAEAVCNAALAKVNKLTAAIEDMKLDCDAEVYEELLKIADILGR